MKNERIAYTDEELRKLHEVLLKLLSEVNRICEKYNITYFATGGTAIGAVRHKGFIPWDDDLDIGMTRDNYEKFLKVCKDELSDQFFILNYETNKNYYAYFSKLCIRGTTFVESETTHLKYDHCVFLDIFPYDNVPNDLKQRNKFYKKINISYQLYKCKSLWKVSNLAGKKQKLIGSFARPIIHILLLPIPKKSLYNHLNNLIQSYNNTNCCYITTLGHDINLVEKKNSEDIITVPFENISIHMFRNYDSWLRQQYGDYMSLPPVNKRQNHCPSVLKFGD